MHSKLILVIAVMFFIAINAKASTTERKTCQVQQLGWHFYCDPDKEEADSSEKKEAAKKDKAPEDYIAERDAIRKEIEWKLSRAILYPTNENILDYIKTQREKVMEPTTSFTQKWQKTIWTNPDQDYTLKHPVSTVAKEVATDDSNKIKAASIDKINEHYGVFFFYSSTCPYCQRFSPILKEFSEKHHMQVMPVSMDGVFLPEWPDSVVNQGQSEKMGIKGKPIPATILFNKKTKEVVPIGFGLLAMDELEQRIYTMTNGEGNAQ